MPRMMLVALGFLAGLLLLTSAGLTRWWTEDEGEKTLDGLTPNPPKDTDGRREESGRGVRELQGK